MKIVVKLFLAMVLLSSCSQPEQPTAFFSEPHHPSDKVMLTNEQILLANINVQRISRGKVSNTQSVPGRVILDADKTNVVSVRTSGRIDKLLIKETGTRINTGQALYELYSEELVVLQQEYLLTREQNQAFGNTEKRFDAMEKSAEKKLLLFGLTKNQISALAQKKITSPRTTFYATTSGVVTSVEVSEGQYVTEGTPVYRINDVDGVWVEADVFVSETGSIQLNDAVEVRIPGNEPIVSQVTFLNPAFKNNSQVVQVRASLPNANGNLRPGMLAQVFFRRSVHDGISVPYDAVIRGSDRALVFLQKGANTYQPASVVTGLESFDSVEIISGLQEGDTVVSSGAYLLYSEFVLKKGKDPLHASVSNQ